MGLLIYLLYTRVDLCFALHKLAKFLSNTGKVQYESLVHLLRYVRDNNILCLIYYSNIEYVPISYLLIQSIINTENQSLVFSDSSWKDCWNTDRITRSCIVFYQVVSIGNYTHVLVSVSQFSSESNYNSSYTARMDI